MPTTAYYIGKAEAVLEGMAAAIAQYKHDHPKPAEQKGMLLAKLDSIRGKDWESKNTAISELSGQITNLQSRLLTGGAPTTEKAAEEFLQKALSLAEIKTGSDTLDGMKPGSLRAAAMDAGDAYHKDFTQRNAL